MLLCRCDIKMHFLIQISLSDAYRQTPCSGLRNFTRPHSLSGPRFGRPPVQTDRYSLGLLLAVRNDSRYHVEDHTSDSAALWVRLCPTASQAPIVVGVCYLPTAGSLQLQHHSFPHRMDSLACTLLATPGIAQVADARLPPALFLPDCAYPQQDPARAAAVNADITVAEVVSQLPKLHNGRSAGHADLPAEFLRYARQLPQPNQPLPPHLLAPILADVLSRP